VVAVPAQPLGEGTAHAWLLLVGDLIPLNGPLGTSLLAVHLGPVDRKAVPVAPARRSVWEWEIMESGNALQPQHGSRHSRITSTRGPSRQGRGGEVGRGGYGALPALRSRY
jgi:hypothetical protein